MLIFSVTLNSMHALEMSLISCFLAIHFLGPPFILTFFFSWINSICCALIWYYPI
jgi:hypothetical protein